MRYAIAVLAAQRRLVLQQAAELRGMAGTAEEKASQQARALELDKKAKQCADACSVLWTIVYEKEKA